MTDRRALLAGIAGGAVAGASNLTAGVAKRKGRHGSGGAGKPKPGKPDQRPNVVLIIADDMRSRDWIALNRTRELLNDGVWFENFIINNPMCSPSRTTLLTGQCSHNHGVVRNVGDDDEAGFDAYQSLRLDDVALAPLLQESGYQTAMVGKFINGYELGMRQPAGWTRWVGRETLDYTNYDLQVDRDRVSFRGERQYITDVLRDYACDFIRSAAPELPLYLYLSMAAPHAPNEPARRHRDLYPGAVVERDLSFNEADTSDKPSRVANVGPLAP